MKITHSAANTYGYISIGVMIVLLALVLFNWVPRSWYYPLFGVALALYLVRITLRLILARQARMDRMDKGEVKEDDGSGPDAGA